MDCSLPGSSIHGILQARILEWVAISFSRDWIQVSCILGRCFTIWATREVHFYRMVLINHLRCIYTGQEDKRDGEKQEREKLGETFIQRLSFLDWIVKKKILHGRKIYIYKAECLIWVCRNDAGCWRYIANKLGPWVTQSWRRRNRQIATVTLYKYYNT